MLGEMRVYYQQTSDCVVEGSHSKVQQRRNLGKPVRLFSNLFIPKVHPDGLERRAVPGELSRYSSSSINDYGAHRNS